MPLVEDDEEDVNTFLPTSNIQQSLAVLVQVCVCIYIYIYIYMEAALLPVNNCKYPLSYSHLLYSRA